MTEHTKLFSPGPTPLSKEVLKILGTPPLHHRSKEFESTVKNVIENLNLLFDEKYATVFCSTGTGALEACILNFLKSTDFSLTLDGGKFGERWSKILTTYKLNHEVYKFTWGHTPCSDTLSKLLQKFQPQALFTQACETSTATLYDIQSLAQLIKTHSPNTLLIVDGITAVGAYPLSMKKLEIDVLISGSQKALGLPTGLSLIGISERALEKAKVSDLPKFYFDILKEVNSNAKNSTTFSSPTQLWQSLEYELNQLKQKGLEQKFNQNARLQQMIANWCLQQGFSLFSKSPSPSLTAIELPKANKVQEKLMLQGYYVAGGQDKLKNKVIRVGHMANITEKDMEKFLQVLNQCIYTHPKK